MTDSKLPKVLRVKRIIAGIDIFFIAKVVVIASVVVTAIVAAIYAFVRLFSVDTATATLIIAMAAVVTTVLVTVLDATMLERRRQQTKLTVEREALRKGLYDEMADIIHVFHQIVFTDLFLMKMKRMPRTIDVHQFLFQQSLLNEMKTKIDRFVSFDVYNSANREPVLFFGLEDEARNINRFYKMIKNGISELDSTIDLVPDEARPPTEEDLETKVYCKHNFLEIFEDTFLKKAISYLDEDSLDYLGQCIDLDDREYFVSLKGERAGQAVDLQYDASLEK